MKLWFIFDTVMLKDENEDYYAINLNYKLWKERYLKTFDSMVVSTRMKELSYQEIMAKKGYTISNGEGVEIKPITKYNKITDAILNRKQIEKELREILDTVDCVIIRMPSPLGNIACDICRKYKKKYAIEMVACPWNNYRNHGHWLGKVVAPFMYYETKRQCQKANRVLYVSKNFLQNRYPTNGKTTNASNVMINQSAPQVLEKRFAQINQEKNVYRLGLVGTLGLKYKGHLVALKALKILKREYPQIVIELLGPGDDPQLKKYITKNNLENNVILKGTLPSGEPVLNWMDQLDILVIPSYTEGLPRVLIEAMSRGCPAVGSSAGGIPELIRKELLHKPGDYNKLAKDIKRIIESKEYALLLAKENFDNAKQYATEQLDIRRNNFWQEFRDE
ncbi:MAG: glycosyltransferase [bacterium]|nr:glycosyltransferase [bacterium]